MSTEETPTIFRINGEYWQRPNGSFQANIADGDVLYLWLETTPDPANHYKVVAVRRPDPSKSFKEGLFEPFTRIIDVYHFQDGIVDQVCRTWARLQRVTQLVMRLGQAQ